MPLYFCFDCGSTPGCCAVQGMRVEVDFEGGKSSGGIYVHKHLPEAMGNSVAAFAHAMLCGHTSPGVWYPEEREALSVSTMRACHACMSRMHVTRAHRVCTSHLHVTRACQSRMHVSCTPRKHAMQRWTVARTGQERHGCFSRPPYVSGGLGSTYHCAAHATIHACTT
jgi:hypothetical protein